MDAIDPRKWKFLTENQMRDFHDMSYEKHVFKKIKTIIQKTKEIYQQDLDAKRVRLKEMLDSEDAAFEDEYRRKVHDKLEDELAQRQESLLAIAKQRVKERTEFVRKKRAQQIIANSDDIRTMLRDKLLRETKLCQVKQMEENRERFINEKKQDCMWLEVQNKEALKKAEQQRQRDEMKKQMNRNDVCYNLRRMAEIEAEKKEKTISEFHKGNALLVGKELLTKEEAFKKKREDQRKRFDELKYHVELRRGIEKQMQDDDRRYTDILKALNVNELKKQPPKRFKTSEAEAYLDYVQETKADIARREAETEAMADLEEKRAQCKVLTRHRKLQHEREKLAKNTFKGLLQQLEQNEAKKDRDKIMRGLNINGGEQGIVQREVFIRQDQDYYNAQREKKLRNDRYYAELKETMCAKRELKAQQKQYEFDERKRLNAIEEINAKQALEIVNKDDQFLLAHPNWKYIACNK